MPTNETAPNETSLLETIRSDMTAAMKAKDELTKRTLRSAIAAVQEAQVAGETATVLDDAEVQKVLAAQVKRRVEAAEAFEEGGRPEKAADERAEITVLEAYLPKALTEDELVALIEATLTAEGYATKADMGPAMKAVNAEVAGRADGRTVAELVKARLA